MILETVLTAKAKITRFTGYRCLHYKEGGLPNPVGMPNVRPAENAPPVPFTPELQDLSWRFMTFKNPTVSRDEWGGVFRSDTAFCNDNGVETNHAKLMKATICSGMFIRGRVENGYLVCTPGIDAIDANKPLPSVQQILDNNWYFVATTGMGKEGVFNFPQGDGGPIFVIYVLTEPVYYPIQKVDETGRYTNFARWDADFLPDPLRYYLPV